MGAPSKVLRLFSASSCNVPEMSRQWNARESSNTPEKFCQLVLQKIRQCVEMVEYLTDKMNWKKYSLMHWYFYRLIKTNIYHIIVNFT